ncbi:MAG: hypothetical protein M3Y46_08245 [Actinomycetota bacterium]|nr:hypothetical protein [Actinomycetota bacterium]
MKLYSDYGSRRTRQIIGDVIAIGLIIAWAWLGVTVFQLVQNLSTWGKSMEDAGSGFRETMTEVGETLGGIPLIGGGIRVPFDGASQAGQALEQAGQNQQTAVFQLALVLGIGIAALPIAMILFVWLLPRIRFVRRAGRAQAVVNTTAGLDLLALRALATQRLPAITQIDPDALGAWRRGDEAIVRQLAQLELRASGVKLAGG